MCRRWLVFILVCIAGLLSQLSHAHELRPAYLSITETTDAQYDAAQYEVLWKTPALGEKQLALKVQFPSACSVSNGMRMVEKSNFAIETWTLKCPQSLRGKFLNIGGLDKTLTDVLVRIEWANGEVFTVRLTPDNTRLDFANIGVQGGVSKTYFKLGLQHILGGIDHLLFVLAVMLLIVNGKNLLSRKLFWAITAFTLGHSVTLALASLGLVRFNTGLIETLIAMSIVLMAYEAARRVYGKSGLTLEHPWLVTFSFGLLHGFGFAGALQAIGLPQTDLPLALLCFNIGVEAGQFLFVMCVFVVLSLPVFKKETYMPSLRLAASYCIGIMAVFWTLQRALPLFVT